MHIQLLYIVSIPTTKASARFVRTKNLSELKIDTSVSRFAFVDLHTSRKIGNTLCKVGF